MDEAGQVRQMYELLRAGRVEAATELFEQYLRRRTQVGDEQALRAEWTRQVAARVYGEHAAEFERFDE